jgi:hypothetical protein
VSAGQWPEAEGAAEAAMRAAGGGALRSLGWGVRLGLRIGEG